MGDVVNLLINLGNGVLMRPHKSIIKIQKGVDGCPENPEKLSSLISDGTVVYTVDSIISPLVDHLFPGSFYIATKPQGVSGDNWLAFEISRFGLGLKQGEVRVTGGMNALWDAYEKNRLAAFGTLQTPWNELGISFNPDGAVAFHNIEQARGPLETLASLYGPLRAYLRNNPPERSIVSVYTSRLSAPISL